MNKNIELYNKYFGDTGFERVHLFEVLHDTYSLESAIYPGSFVHVTPAFVFQKTAFVDNDRRVSKFFNDPKVTAMVSKRKQYNEEPDIFAAQQSYEDDLPLEDESYDLLISQYAGFVSQAGKQYLKVGGILVANNSHADAAMAHTDPDYKLIAVANHTDDVWRITDRDLAEYFMPKKGTHPTRAEIQESMKGISYTKAATNYIFRRTA